MLFLLVASWAASEPTQKPVLHGRHWMAITGKPLAATAGAMMFQKGGNAVDAACAMLGATTTMFDALSWGGETQALIYHPVEKKVIGINALGVAPTGATPEFFRKRGMEYPPEFGPLAAVTPGTPGGLLTMLAEYGKLSLKEVLAPAIQMADGYPIEASPPTPSRGRRTASRSGRTRARCFCLTRATGARSALSRRDLRASATSRRRCGSWSRPKRKRSPGKVAKGGDLRRLRSLLSGRHRRGVRPRLAGAGRASYARKISRAGRSISRSRSRRPTRASRSTS